ncbi:hypothetical protein MUK42_33079 [Musa troglodytarum]|uniref:Uncharacterized protein n=1 Tax=Musa troglodytarum TaxID=320322 RepID=A0A9E7G3B3_9LILI|nr:hypothetical protein MUK42_33079 [Musa troglodytarum]
MMARRSFFSRGGDGLGFRSGDDADQLHRDGGRRRRHHPAPRGRQAVRGHPPPRLTLARRRVRLCLLIYNVMEVASGFDAQVLFLMPILDFVLRPQFGDLRSSLCCLSDMQIVASKMKCALSFTIAVSETSLDSPDKISGNLQSASTHNKAK